MNNPVTTNLTKPMLPDTLPLSTEEGNKLISEYMAIKNDDVSFYHNEKGGYRVGTLHFIDLPINYHLPENAFLNNKWNTSWDWLMPVVQKICKAHRPSKDYYLIEAIYKSCFDNSPIKTWEAVVKFIYWYNENKPVSKR